MDHTPAAGAPASSRSARRRGAFVLLLVLGTAVALELLARGGVYLIDRRLGLERVEVPTRPDQLRRLFGGPIRFDADLGWDHVRPVRAGPDGGVPPRRFASAYGDSFTYGSAVGHDQTWTQHFGLITGEAIINLGVEAGSTDQALLKLRRYQRRFPSPVVILGVLPENIRRNVGVFGPFYLRTPRPTIKPRYVADGRGGFQLLPTLVRAPEELARLADPAFTARVARHDYWYQLTRERFGFDLLRGRSGLGLRNLALLAATALRHGLRVPDYRDLFRAEGEEPYRVLLHITRLFRGAAKELGFRPLVVLHCAPEDIDGDGVTGAFVRQVRDGLGIPVFEVAPVFRQAISARRVRREQLHGESMHYSPVGNQIVAEGLAEFVRRRGLLPAPAAPRVP